MEFRLAENNDIDRVFNIYSKAIEEMEKHNINQWDNLYPDKEILQEDIDKKELYICELEGEIACAYVLNSEYDEDYEKGKWHYKDASFNVIHRLCVNPKFQNKGIAGKAIKYIEEVLKNKGIESIRLDVYSLNPFALRLYEKAGYKKTGNAHWRKGEFYLMEKKI